MEPIELVVFALLGLLAVWLLLRSGRSRGGGSKIEFAKGIEGARWFGPVPRGTMTEIEFGPLGFDKWFIFFTFLTLAWMLVSLPQLFGLSVVYLMFGLIALLVLFVEVIAPARVPFAFLYKAGPRDYALSIVYGIPVGFGLLIVASALGLALAPPVAMTGISLLWTSGIAIPLIEEKFMRGVVLPTLVEDVGIVMGLGMCATIFAIFHWFAYEAAIPAMAFAFFFSLVVGVMVLRMRSFWPAFWAHAIFNILVILPKILEGAVAGG